MPTKGIIRIKENNKIVEYYPQTTYDNVIDEVGGNLKTDIDSLKSFKGTAGSKLDTIATGATKTEASSTNGNVKINGTETAVYRHPSTSGNKHIPSGGATGQILRWSADGTAVWGADKDTTYSVATQSANGLMSAADKKKLDGIATGANAYVHPSSHPATMITEDATHRFATDTEKSNWNAKETPSGAQTKATKALTDAKAYADTKVAGIVNSAPETLDTLNELSAALGDDPNFATTIANKLGTKVDKVTGKGLSTNDYTTAEKTKLAGIATGANAYTHPTSAGNKHIPSGGSAGQILRWSADGTAVWGADNNTTYNVATQTANGLMSAADKKKLDGIATGANAYVHPSTHAATMITQDSTHRFVTDSEKSTWNGKANASHGTHVTYATSAPIVAGTASAGSSNDVARGNHVHPAQTSVSGNAGTATKLQTARTINGVAFDGTKDIVTSKWGTARKIGYATVDGSGDIGLNKILGFVSTSSTGTTNKNKYTKFATVDCSKAIYTGCTGYFTFSSSETDHFSGVLQFYFKSHSPISNMSMSLRWTSITNEAYASSVVAVKVSDGKYDLYFHPIADYCIVRITAVSYAPENLTMHSQQGFVDTVTVALTSKIQSVASKLETARKINGVAFDGTKDITIADSTKVAPTGTIVANRVAVFNDTTGKVIKDSGYTIASSVPSGAKFTDTVYTHPTTSGNKHIPSGGAAGQILRWSADGTAVWGADNNTTYNVATQTANGLMSAADKKKLDGIATGANAYTHPTTSGNKHIPSGGAAGQILKWASNGTAAWGAPSSVSTLLPDGSNLNNVTAVGLYHFDNIDGIGNIINDPGWGNATLIVAGFGTNVGRIQIIYNDNDTVMRFRISTNGTTWTSWSRIYTTMDTPTAGEVGALTNHTMSGSVNLNNALLSNGAITGVFASGTTVTNGPLSNCIGSMVQTIGGSATNVYAQTFFGSDGNIYSRTSYNNNGTRTWRSWDRFYHTGNKPTPAAIGAATSTHTHNNYYPYNATCMTGVDYNTLTSPGFYEVIGTESSPLSNYPIEETGNEFVLVLVREVNWLRQIAYNVRNNVTKTRVRTNGTWGSWQMYYTSENKPSPSEIGALPTTGGTMNGALNFANNVWNKLGDDAYFGDCNTAGCVGIKGINGYTGIYFVPHTGDCGQKLYINNENTMIVTGNFYVEYSLIANGLALRDYGTPFECSQYIDFHEAGSNVDVDDYSARLHSSGGALHTSGGLNAGNSNGNVKRTTISSASPSGGANGDVWIKYS